MNTWVSWLLLILNTWIYVHSDFSHDEWPSPSPPWDHWPLQPFTAASNGTSLRQKRDNRQRNTHPTRQIGHSWKWRQRNMLSTSVSGRLGVRDEIRPAFTVGVGLIRDIWVEGAIFWRLESCIGWDTAVLWSIEGCQIHPCHSLDSLDGRAEDRRLPCMSILRSLIQVCLKRVCFWLWPRTCSTSAS